MEDTEFGRELIASLREALAIVRGEAEPARAHPAPHDVEAGRRAERDNQHPPAAPRDRQEPS